VEGLVGVEQWAELRREHFVRGVSIKELVRRTGLSRNTIRVALRAPARAAVSRAGQRPSQVCRFHGRQVPPKSR
jgi:hypothetical protein